MAGTGEVGKKAEANEVWVDVIGFEGYYQVSNLARVKSLARYVNSKGSSVRLIKEKILTTQHFDTGYCYVVLSKDGTSYNVLLHRLVAEAFIPNPENKPEVNHKDGDKDNNFDWNLEWATPSENIQHAYSLGLQVSSSKDHMIDMCEKAMPKVKKAVRCVETGQLFSSMKEAAEELGLWKGAVYEYFNKLRPVGGYTFEKVVM